ncbi:hypothetical protein [Actinoplanes philippinensis]|uniref:hypothetical protein n=1 Tax=Actinoplanes philippinensis TaxID=35752 RepID=UPI00340990B0
MARHANWDLAEHLLKVILPGSTKMTINGLAETPYEIWQPFDIEGREVTEVARDLASRCAHLKGPLIIVNDASYKLPNGPHFVDASRLSEFVDSFPDNFDSAFVSGSMIIAAPATGEIVAVDDENLIAHIKGRPAFSLSQHYAEGLNSTPPGWP